MRILKTLTFLLVILALASSCESFLRGKPKFNFTVSLSSPQLPVGEIETQIEREFPMPDLRKIYVDVSYFPNEDAVLLHYRTTYFWYYQFWNREGRELYRSSLAKYNEDYNQRNFDSGRFSSRRTKVNYGGFEGYLIWQMFQYTRRGNANMRMDMGYDFNNGAPYFTVTQRLTTYEDPLDNEKNMNSQEITMYFTRAQAQVLADMFSQEFLTGLIPSDMRVRRVEDIYNIEMDTY
jgi:hypothetical protein